MDKKYREQVQLLISVIPEIAKEKCFALHGGTAINLFINNMPRLSVDIDLTYIPIENRATSIENINASLDNIKQNIIRYVPYSNVQHNIKNSKLIVNKAAASIKIEVNQVARGTIRRPVLKVLCEKAQADFDAFCEISTVHNGQLVWRENMCSLRQAAPKGFV